MLEWNLEWKLKFDEFVAGGRQRCRRHAGQAQTAKAAHWLLSQVSTQERLSGSATACDGEQQEGWRVLVSGSHL